MRAAGVQALASQMGALQGLTAHAAHLGDDMVKRRAALERAAADHVAAEVLPVGHMQLMRGICSMRACKSLPCNSIMQCEVHLLSSALVLVLKTCNCGIGQAALEGARSQLRTLQADAHEKCAPFCAFFHFAEGEIATHGHA